jgi:hypothetical protein
VSLDSARVLLSKVIFSFSYPFINRFPCLLILWWQESTPACLNLPPCYDRRYSKRCNKKPWCTFFPERRISLLRVSSLETRCPRIDVEGFGRLKKLDLVSCEGYIRMLVENAPIRDLRIFLRNLFWSPDILDDSEIVTEMAAWYPSFPSNKLSVNSFLSFLKVVECCRDLERFSLDVDGFELWKSDLEAIVCLPRSSLLEIPRSWSLQGDWRAWKRITELLGTDREWYYFGEIGE